MTPAPEAFARLSSTPTVPWGPDEIAFDTAGVFASPQTISLLTALPTITESVTITGTGATNLTIQRDPGLGAGDFFAFSMCRNWQR